MSNFAYKIELWNGTVLSEILNPIISSCSWSYNRIGGCNDAQITVKANYDDYATVTPAWKIKAQVRFTSLSDFYQVFIGNVVERCRILGEPERVSFRAVGYMNQLSKTVIYRHPVTDEPASYAGMTIKQILVDLLDDYIIPFTDITYATGDIDNPAITPESLLFDTTALNAIQLLATLAGNYEWGINGSGAFYFKAKSTTRAWNFFAGAPNVVYWEDESDGLDITNRIYLTGNYGLDEILECENDLTSVSQLVGGGTLPFGTATLYTDLLQTFTQLTNIKNIYLEFLKNGFADSITDGNMEAVGVTNWPDYGTGTITKEKKTDTPFEGFKYLRVTTSKRGIGVYQQMLLTGGKLYSIYFASRLKSSSAILAMQIYNVTDDYYEFAGTVSSKTWTIFNQSFTCSGAGSKTCQIRFFINENWGSSPYFDIDDVNLNIEQDDIEVWLTTAADPSTALKKVIIPAGKWIQASIVASLNYDSLIYGTSYGLRIRRTGTLSDSHYYILNTSANNQYNNGTLYSSIDSGANWVDRSRDAVFKLQYSASQGIYGIRAERIKNNSISIIEDAQLWVNSYLSNKIAPQNRGTLRIQDNGIWFEQTPPINLLSIRTKTGTQIDRQINSVTYDITENGLDISLDLGTPAPRISDYLGWVEYQLEQLRG